MADAVRLPVAVGQEQVDRFRLRRHLLAPRGPATPLEIAGSVGGLHAQVHSCAELMAWARSSTLRRGELDRGLYEDRSLVKSWFMRGTLHVVAAHDLHLWGAARDLEPPAAAWFNHVEMTPALFEEVMEAVPEALGRRPMTRKELAGEVGRRHGETVGAKLLWGWGTLLKPLARRGLLIAGPMRGQEVTFVLPSAWLGGFPRWTPAEAAAEAARRYLRAYGPATRGDFERWLGVRPSSGRVAWGAIAAELEEVSVDGRRAWALRTDLQELESGDPPPGQARLLGGFDTYLLGHVDRTHLWDRSVQARISRTAGWITPVLLCGGRAAGVWSFSQGRGALKVEVEPFDRLRRAWRTELEADAERLAAFYDLRLDLTVAAA